MDTTPIINCIVAPLESSVTLATLDEPADAFDYTTLPADVAESLRTEAERIRHRITKSTQDLVEIGQALNAAKRKLEHGQFTLWVETKIGIGRRSAQRYMNVADFVESKSVTVTLLTPSAVYKLAAKNTPAEVVDAALQRAAAGELVTDEEVDRLFRGAKVTSERLDERRETQRASLFVPDQTDGTPSAQSAQRSEDRGGAKEAAYKLFDVLGPGMARTVIDLLQTDPDVILEELCIILARPTVSAPAVVKSKIEDRPARSKYPTLPDFLRRSDEGGVS